MLSPQSELVSKREGKLWRLQYFHPWHGKKHACCCDNKYCHGIAYTTWRVQIPVDKQELAVDALKAHGHLVMTMFNRTLMELENPTAHVLFASK